MEGLGTSRRRQAGGCCFAVCLSGTSAFPSRWHDVVRDIPVWPLPLPGLGVMPASLSSAHWAFSRFSRWVQLGAGE